MLWVSVPKQTLRFAFFLFRKENTSCSNKLFIWHKIQLVSHSFLVSKRKAVLVCRTQLTFRTIRFYFETIFNIVVTDSTSRVLSLTISAIPIRASSVLVDDSGPHFTANSFPTPSFPLTSEKFHFVSFHFISFGCCPVLTPGPQP